MSGLRIEYLDTLPVGGTNKNNKKHERLTFLDSLVFLYCLSDE
ncbi:hypothetical protein Lbys_2054 [Leadbetterella byssophila DSM 17132]|uniref:Uncharacterized protein n=1 Tax=Leadbetterella byssophila (strain DSM 17132 / JCM 16389 / KACC 11308 / NBRC 106382 / 4M15) TaxID=649349 RepID=E4RT42_LEAB4|nr:hypothetical protein Lbys_2054 [Leadbetterella byssophila DSM 17132]